ncbi:MucR family transcriptional regulator [Azospirillum thermophilum]|uniref:MucR family transcriptional regulator n=1 Tax=Azospirillum thermophilum TaxID=2202148 RepID=A0A2S2CM61_9PROT|nr:MucR family transcriptional regulator [Azospirillum thermophilum]AWK85584.1 MucR family transcriptional regulator [Azospirillum thermophilum]
MSIESSELQSLTAKVVAAFVGNNTISVDELPTLINNVQSAFRNLGEEKAAPIKVELVPAVPIKKSVTPDYIICLEDGKKLKMLKRHLKTVYDLSPDEYRAKWGLPAEYPMVAPNYAKARSEMATKLGLGRKRVIAD